MGERYRIFATCDIGGEALARLRERGWDLEVYPEIQPPPKKLVLEKVRSGVDALVTTLRDRIDEEVFAAGAASSLKVVAQMAVGFDNIDRAAANRHRIPFTNTADVLTDATAEFAFFILGAVARKLYPAEVQVRAHQWSTWHPHKPWLGDEVTGRTLAVVGMGRIGTQPRAEGRRLRHGRPVLRPDARRRRLPREGPRAWPSCATPRG